ncbi:MAG: Txe/YoeB family addiction module toxin [Merismopedia sp. SIO2A8]|nr:Txe/YoeB family addiction module toxin [Symploca sp. SIO2B6]NET51364.1 Txe/YoeB family addiction module toxin [Merismopedia sp. SIO2A8]
MKRRIIFEASAFEDFTEWSKLNKKIHQKIIQLIKDIGRNPYAGLGKPEALKYDYQGYWSRRINAEHRLIYKVTDTDIIIVGCKYHYE